MRSLIDWKIAELVLDVDVVNKDEVIIEVSLIAAEGFHDGSRALS